MKLQRQQQGITLFGVAFILLLISFATFTTLKLFPVYMQNFSVRGSLQSMEGEKGREYLGAVAVRDTILKRLSINNVTQVDKKDIKIKRDGQTYKIDIDYEVRVPYMSNISLVISFKNHAEVEAQ
jgi:hypothetical protein